MPDTAFSTKGSDSSKGFSIRLFLRPQSEGSGAEQVDLYRPQIDILNNLYPKLSVGGFAIIDDYFELGGCRRATNWKVVALVSGNIEAFLGPAAQDRPGTHEWIVWEGQAADKAEALQSAGKADPRVDLEWMRIRYERDLNIRWDLALPLEVPFPKKPTRLANRILSVGSGDASVQV